MAVDKLLALNVAPNAIAQSSKFRDLVEEAIETLRALLTSEHLSVQERASLALKILEIDQQQATSQKSTANTSNPEPLNLSDAWKEWIVENKLRQVPETVLIETMVREGIDVSVATQAVKTLVATKNPLINSETFQNSHNLSDLSSCLTTSGLGDRTSTNNSHIVSQVLQIENFLTVEENHQLLRYAIEREAAFVPSSTATNAIAYR
jgi:CRISPR/Cas system CMR-associated protein Cmr5 small subunit